MSEIKVDCTCKIPQSNSPPGPTNAANKNAEKAAANAAAKAATRNAANKNAATRLAAAKSRASMAEIRSNVFFEKMKNAPSKVTKQLTEDQEKNLTTITTALGEYIDNVRSAALAASATNDIETAENAATEAEAALKNVEERDKVLTAAIAAINQSGGRRRKSRRSRSKKSRRSQNRITRRVR